MRAWSLLTVIAFVILYGMYWSTMNFIELDSVKYFGMLRYKLFSNIELVHDDTDVAIEPWVFSYYFDAPYLYTYGVSGYTKTNVMPLGRIEKVCNYAFYQTVSTEFVSASDTTIQRFKEKFGNQLILKESLQAISKEDRKVFEELKKKGGERKVRYFNLKSQYFYKKSAIH